MPVPVAVSLPSDVASAREGRARALSSAPRLLPSRLNHFYLYFLLEEGGEGEDPEIPHPTTTKATASPSAEPRR